MTHGYKVTKNNCQEEIIIIIFLKSEKWELRRDTQDYETKSQEWKIWQSPIGII